MSYTREIIAYGEPYISECDGRCCFVYWDGIYEDGCRKPDSPKDFNKWCFRACPNEHHYTKKEK